MPTITLPTSRSPECARSSSRAASRRPRSTGASRSMSGALRSRRARPSWGGHRSARVAPSHAPATVDEHHAAAGPALLFAALGEMDAAIAAIDELDLELAPQLPFDLAWTQLVRGQLLRRAKQKQAAARQPAGGVEHVRSAPALPSGPRELGTSSRVSASASFRQRANDIGAAHRRPRCERAHQPRGGGSGVREYEDGRGAPRPRLPLARHPLARGLGALVGERRGRREPRLWGRRPISRRRRSPTVAAWHNRRFSSSTTAPDCRSRSWSARRTGVRCRRRPGRSGKPLSFLRSLIVPDDESFLSVVEAASEQLVREASPRPRFRSSGSRRPES